MKRLAFATLLLLAAAAAQARDASLSWTAPFDNVRAVSYDLRYKTTPVAGTDTLGWIANSGSVPNLPVPSVAGLKDSVRVTGLDPTKGYYFILTTLDAAGNRAPWSNVAYLAPLAIVDTSRPAAVVNLTASPR